MTTRQFNFPDEIREHYGEKIDNFSKAGKRIARLMTEAGFTPEEILPIVGRGRYNTLDAQGYVLYGPEAHKNARDNIEGLFGAFFYVHLPELRMCSQATKLLGEAGFKFTCLVGDTLFEVPLNKVKFGFQVGQRSEIIITEDVTLRSADGQTHRINAGTPVMQGREWVKRPEEAWRQHCGIVDANGRGLQQLACAYALWGQQGAKGMKALAEDGPERSALMYPGTDDDFTAEGFMVQWLNTVRDNHGINLMHHFNRFIEAARDGLMARPDLLRSMNMAIALGEGVEQYREAAKERLGSDNRSGSHEGSAWTSLRSYHEQVHRVRDIVTTLGLTMPPMEEARVAVAPIIARIANRFETQTLPKARVLDEQYRIEEAERIQRCKDEQNARRKVEQLQSLRDKLGSYLRQNADILDINAWRTRRHNVLNQPYAFEPVRMQLEQRLAELGAGNVTLESLAKQYYRLLACKRIAGTLSTLADGIRNVPHMACIRQISAAAPDGMANLNTTVKEGVAALNTLQDAFYNKRPEGLDLQKHAPAIERLAATLDALFSPSAQETNMAVASRKRHASHDRSYVAAQAAWKHQRGPLLDRLVSLMRGIQYDAKLWMELYSDAGAVTGQPFVAPALYSDAAINPALRPNYIVRALQPRSREGWKVA